MVLEVKNLTKFYPGTSGEPRVNILENTNLQIAAQEKVAIVGPSGCGKSTLLSLLAGLERPNEGEICFYGNNFSQMSENQITKVRAEYMGIVFQQFHLMNHLNALENVELPLSILNKSPKKKMALEALEQVHMSHRLKHFPEHLSGGEKQRVAIARALVNKPKMLLSDEPTGSLDEENGRTIINLFFQLVNENKTSLLLVTHNLDLAQKCDRVLSIEQGKIVQKTTQLAHN